MATTVINIKKAPPGWKSNPLYVYGGRGSKWGNQFRIGDPDPSFKMNQPPMTRDRVCDLHSIHAAKDEAVQAGIHDGELRDVIMVCFCKPERCHCDTLASWSNALWGDT